MNILDFASPINWWWALLALPIVGLYILKVRLRRVPASTLLFWNQLYDEKKPKSWWQQLRHWLSLLLQLLFLLLCTAALVDPLWSWQKETQRSVVLVVDNSASMQAEGPGGVSRLEEAKGVARNLIHSLRDQDRMAIVSSGGVPEVVLGMTNHSRWLQDSIDELGSTDAPSVLQDSVALAGRLLSGIEGNVETIVLTDGCSPGLSEWEDDETVQIYGVGEAADNLAITRYQVRRSVVDAIGYQVLVDVTNFGVEKAETRLELDLDEELIDVLPVAVEPGETVTRIVDHTSAIGGVMRATLGIVDGMEADNLALAVLPSRRPFRITLVSEGNLFVASVLSSVPLVELNIVGEASAVDAAACDLVVFDKAVPQQLPSGNVLVVDPQSDCNLWKVGEQVEQPIVASVNSDSPLTQHVRLDNVLFPGARELDFSVDARPLIQDPLDQPLLAQVPRSGGDVIVLTCSLEKGDLPLRIAFPVLIKNTLEWFQGIDGELQAAVKTGQVASVRVGGLFATPAVPGKSESAGDDTVDESSAEPATSSDTFPESNAESAIVATESADIEIVAVGEDESSRALSLESPEGELVELVAPTERIALGPLLHQGVWKLRRVREDVSQDTEAATSDGSESDGSADQSAAVGMDGSAESDDDWQAIACNLTSAEESNLIPQVEYPKADHLSRSLFGGRSLWFYLTMLAVVLLATEWWLYQRRIVG
ncbi:MAG: BatA and WFA domain-containing protein [Planctomycetota bacterium]